jgi:hypothetical protein
VFADRGVAIAFSVSEGINEVTSNADSDDVVPKSTSSTSSRDLSQARFWEMARDCSTSKPELGLGNSILSGGSVFPAARDAGES